MRKIELHSKECQIDHMIVRNEATVVFYLKDGSVLKCFDRLFLEIFSELGMNVEQKILDAKEIAEVPEIIIPDAAVYDSFLGFTGYKMRPAEGIDLNSYDETASLSDRGDLYKYALMHNKIEDIVKRGNKNNIIFPDLCTCDNIYITPKGDLSFIDYDGLQVGNHMVVAMSTSLGDDSQYFQDKYINGNLFTPELDKKSLLILYFLDTFNADLNKVGAINPLTGRAVTLDDIFEMLNITDLDFMNKVANTLNPKKPGEYIGEDVIRLAHDNYLDVYQHPIMKQHYLKKLRRK